MEETWVQSLGQEDTLEEDMATHSSILAWRILWTEESSRLQSLHSQSGTQLNDRVCKGFPGGARVKNPPANAGDVSSIPGLEDPLEKGMATRLLYSCLKNSMDKGSWWARVHGLQRV